MRNVSPGQWAAKILVYILGLFFLALGVALSVNAGLGISPVNSLPYVISKISGSPLSLCVILVFSSYILLQALILRREFKLINLTQILFSTIFGYLVDFCKFVLGDAKLPGYLGSLIMLAASIGVVALGVVLYIEADLVPMPMEGLTLAAAYKTRRSFHSVKIIIDCAAVLAALFLSLLFLGGLDGIREGTIIAAVVTGKVTGCIKRRLPPLFARQASSQQECRRP